MLTKEEARKRHLSCAGPSGYLALHSVAGMVKNSLRLRQFYRLIPATVVGKYNTADD